MVMLASLASGGWEWMGVWCSGAALVLYDIQEPELVLSCNGFYRSCVMRCADGLVHDS
jgi:hypothetical protein